MPHDHSNILELERFRRAIPESTPRRLDRSGDVKAIATCLDYLYGELLKLDEKMTAHLVGAAAESLRQNLPRSDEDG
jgi:hypothetical protein